MRLTKRRTPTARAANTIAPPALPYPTGWFCIGLTREWKPGTVLTKPFMGQDVVAYRTRRGLLRVTRPHCPHLGAHLGVGGTVDGELLVCPYHGFGYAPNGHCVRTPYGTPPKASLGLLPAKEAHGVVWVWHGPAGTPPTWEVPELTIPGRITRCEVTEIATHPQEIMENASDFGHGPVLHGWAAYDMTPEPGSDGPVRPHRGLVHHRFPLLGTFAANLKLTLVGLGAVHAEFTVYDGTLHAMAFVLATPTDPWRTRVWVVSSGELGGLPAWLPMRALLARVLEHPMSRVMSVWSLQQFRQDQRVWHHKLYLPHPKLNDGDGPIGAYRLWARQFYPPGAAAGHETHVPKNTATHPGG